MKYVVAIELNGVVRNINKQILKYYKKDFDQSIDLDDIDEKDDPFKYAKFDSMRDRNEFMYIDYPFEIFGCAKAMEENLPTIMNNFLAELLNHEEDDIEVVFYSMDEEALTIQSSYFFLSKIGTRVRKTFFPKDISEVDRQSDIVVTSNPKSFADLPDEKFKILIKNTQNESLSEKADLCYDSLSEMLEDEDIIKKITVGKNRNGQDG